MFVGGAGDIIRLLVMVGGGVFNRPAGMIGGGDVICLVGMIGGGDCIRLVDIVLGGICRTFCTGLGSWTFFGTFSGIITHCGDGSTLVFAGDKLFAEGFTCSGLFGGLVA